MEGEFIAAVETLTGRTVRVFLSQLHLSPEVDVDVEVFVFEPEPGGAQR
jgi:hypothetical protein